MEFKERANVTNFDSYSLANFIAEGSGGGEVLLNAVTQVCAPRHNPSSSMRLNYLQFGFLQSVHPKLSISESGANRTLPAVAKKSVTSGKLEQAEDSWKALTLVQPFLCWNKDETAGGSLNPATIGNSGCERMDYLQQLMRVSSVEIRLCESGNTNPLLFFRQQSGCAVGQPG